MTKNSYVALDRGAFTSVVGKMKKLIFLTLASMMVFSGCATTKNLIAKAEGTKPSLSPLEQVLKAEDGLTTNLHSIEVRQIFNQVENPDVGQISVLKAGLQDDSVAAERTTYHFKMMNNEWKLVNKKQEYKCVRGQNTKTFQTNLCP